MLKIGPSLSGQDPSGAAILSCHLGSAIPAIFAGMNARKGGTHLDQMVGAGTVGAETIGSSDILAKPDGRDHDEGVAELNGRAVLRPDTGWSGSHSAARCDYHGEEYGCNQAPNSGPSSSRAGIGVLHRSRDHNRRWKVSLFRVRTQPSYDDIPDLSVRDCRTCTPRKFH